MLKGDLSNRALPIVAFNFESVFMRPIPFYDKIIRSKYQQIKRNFIQENTKVLKQIWDREDAQIHIVSFLEEDYCKAIEEFLNKDLIMYNSFYKLSEEQLPFKCDYQYFYYVDNIRDRFPNSRTLKNFKGVLC